MAAVATGAGLSDIVAGLGNVSIGGGFLTKIGFGGTLDGIMAAVGLALVLVGALGLAAGLGLWQLRKWAWLIAELWAILCVVVGVLAAGLSLFGDSRVSESWPPSLPASFRRSWAWWCSGTCTARTSRPPSDGPDTPSAALGLQPW